MAIESRPAVRAVRCQTTMSALMLGDSFSDPSFTTVNELPVFRFLPKIEEDPNCVRPRCVLSCQTTRDLLMAYSQVEPPPLLSLDSRTTWMNLCVLRFSPSIASTPLRYERLNHRTMAPSICG